MAPLERVDAENGARDESIAQLLRQLSEQTTTLV
jgi:hypothetical protein